MSPKGKHGHTPWEASRWQGSHRVNVPDTAGIFSDVPGSSPTKEEGHGHITCPKQSAGHRIHRKGLPGLLVSPNSEK